MSFYVVDVEADGPCPGLYSMVCFGAVRVEDSLTDTFYGEVKPISEDWIPEALAVSGIERGKHERFPDPIITMKSFAQWIEKTNKSGRPVFISDNNSFDWSFINYYFHAFYGSNPFGYSSRRIGDIYCGLQKNGFAKWKHLRDTKHTHDPVDDAKGNAEALLKIRDMGVKLNLK